MKHLLLMTQQLPLFIPINAYCNEQGWFVNNTTNPDEALLTLTNQPVAAVIWDISSTNFDQTQKMMPDIRKHLNGPIIILAKERHPEHAQQLFAQHVDDYLTQPYDYPELIAILKQRFWLYDQISEATVTSQETADNQSLEDKNQINFHNLTIDLKHYRVLRDDQDLGLTPKEFKLLRYLMKHPNQVLSREQLLQGVWDYDILGTSRMVDIHISHLRDKIEMDPQNPQWLKTVRGFGYVLKSEA